MTLPVVLDADGLDAACDAQPPARLRALLHEAWLRQRDVVVPAVVCAELCRGVPRTRRVEAAVARLRPPISVIVTDFALARQVGAILYGTGAGSADIVDAHVVAVCALRGGGLVVTADAADITRLARAVPSARILARRVR